MSENASAAAVIAAITLSLGFARSINRADTGVLDECSNSPFSVERAAGMILFGSTACFHEFKSRAHAKPLLQVQWTPPHKTR